MIKYLLLLFMISALSACSSSDGGDKNTNDKKMHDDDYASEIDIEINDNDSNASNSCEKCSENAECITENGEQKCVCNNGYDGDGENCYIICNENPPGIVSSIGGHALDVAFQKNFIYVANEYGGLYIYDVSAPDSPLLTSSIITYDAVISISVSGDYAYLSSVGKGLVIANISDPINPVVM